MRSIQATRKVYCINYCKIKVKNNLLYDISFSKTISSKHFPTQSIILNCLMHCPKISCYHFHLIALGVHK